MPKVIETRSCLHCNTKVDITDEGDKTKKIACDCGYTLVIYHDHHLVIVPGDIPLMQNNKRTLKRELAFGQVQQILDDPKMIMSLWNEAVVSNKLRS
jgi:hypothetical protein